MEKNCNKKEKMSSFFIIIKKQMKKQMKKHMRESLSRVIDIKKCKTKIMRKIKQCSNAYALELLRLMD